MCFIEIHYIQVPEHAQSGFLSGANFLLPWDVQVRLENAASWARTLDKARHRRKPQPISRDDTDGHAFMLKIFVGCEYECHRGHRFFMSSPDTILRGGSGNSMIKYLVEFKNSTSSIRQHIFIIKGNH